MRALFSVSDKTGVTGFARALEQLGWEIVATGGTETRLREAGIKVTSISDVTGFPEICEGRVKTLHPAVHGALLGRRDKNSHMAQLQENGIGLIDLVCVNLYPFEATIAREGVTMEEAVENIDIGGPSMLRSAAKNWRDVTVVCDPSDYDTVLTQIASTGSTTPEERLRLSAKAYTHTALYDSHIASYMRSAAGLPEKLFLDYDLVQTLRYGENPHQQARFYRGSRPEPFSVAHARQLGGKELSYNNLRDADAALTIAREFSEPFCVGLKHANPCGAAVGSDIAQAWRRTYEADPVSIYGGIVAVNRELTEEVALMLKPIFLEIVMAPSFSEGALEILTKKKNLRILQVDMTSDCPAETLYVSVNGGLLAQDADMSCAEVNGHMCVTETRPTETQIADMNFGWRIVKHIKSNAICVVKDGRTLGIGAGQMNRVGSARIALEQAREAGHTEDLVLASDGFLPFDDTVELASGYGVKAIVQPGGSIHDEDSVRKADEKGITMLFTGERHFKH